MALVPHRLLVNLQYFNFLVLAFLFCIQCWNVPHILYINVVSNCFLSLVTQSYNRVEYFRIVFVICFHNAHVIVNSLVFSLIPFDNCSSYLKKIYSILFFVCSDIFDSSVPFHVGEVEAFFVKPFVFRRYLLSSFAFGGWYCTCFLFNPSISIYFREVQLYFLYVAQFYFFVF